MNSHVQELRSLVSRHGLAHTAFNLGYKIVNRAVTAKVYKVMVLTRDGINHSLTGSDERWGFLSREHLERFAKADPALNLGDEFLSHAFAHGCQCYGFVQDGTLGSYLWCTNRSYPSPPSMPLRLTVKFDPDYVYAFNTFTAPAFRGLRLHSIGMARALQILAEHGIKGGIGYVEVNNRSSSKSCVGHSFRMVGTAAYFAVGRKGVAYSSPGCKPYDFRVCVDEISWQAANNPSIHQPLLP